MKSRNASTTEKRDKVWRIVLFKYLGFLKPPEKPVDF
jgi:hypothetical protein